MPQIRMYWDGIDALGDDTADIEILNGNEDIEIPENACGFRLGLPNHSWNEYWHFAEPLSAGTPFEGEGGFPYSSAHTGPSPDAIEARGPVHGCNSGSYVFQTPLGIAADAPVVEGAGSFLADFNTATDITWLDTAGEPLELPEPEPGLEPPDLPPEFFEPPPDVNGLFQRF